MSAVPEEPLEQTATLFGAVKLHGSNWLIKCEPHVRNRMRRVFPKVVQHAADVLHLSNSLENCRELEWFLLRFPMVISTKHKAILSERASQHLQDEERVADLIQFRIPMRSFELAEPARDYQLVAANLLQVKKGLLCADKLGLGKTITGICSLADAENIPAAVICPPHLAKQWQKQINRFAPHLAVHIARTGSYYDLTYLANKKDQSSRRLYDVVILSYHKLNGWAEKLAGVIRYVIFDEIQELRHTGSAKYAAAKMLAGKAQLRLGLSATPIFNYGKEFFNVLEILLPGALGTENEFTREWCVGPKLKDPKAFGAFLRREGMMIRRSREEVKQQLPEGCFPIVHTIESEGLNMHASSAASVLAEIILKANQSFQGEKFKAAQEFNILMRQATGVAKAVYVAQFVKMLLESGETVVLFGWHREVYSLWLEQLKDYNPLMYTGSESPTQKEKNKDLFINSDEHNLLIISLRSGSGLDGLQHVCSVVVHGELDWSPGVHDQCTGRVDRDGQLSPVLSYFLVSDEGSDPVIADILGIKRGQIEGVTDPDADSIESLQIDEGGIQRLAKEYLESLGKHVKDQAMSAV
jgi:SNF2 family DNA or RNA helicase